MLLKFKCFICAAMTASMPLVAVAEDAPKIILESRTTNSREAFAGDPAALEIACPEGTSPWSLDVSHAIDKALYSRFFDQETSRRVVVRRAGEASDTSEVIRTFGSVLNPNYISDGTVAVNFEATAQVCETSGFLLLTDGSVRLTGMIGNYAIAFESPLTGEADDLVSVVWENHSGLAPAADPFGSMTFVLADDIVSATHSESGAVVSTSLTLRLSVNVTAPEVSQ